MLFAKYPICLVLSGSFVHDCYAISRNGSYYCWAMSTQAAELVQFPWSAHTIWLMPVHTTAFQCISVPMQQYILLYPTFLFAVAQWLIGSPGQLYLISYFKMLAWSQWCTNGYMYGQCSSAWAQCGAVQKAFLYTLVPRNWYHKMVCKWKRSVKIIILM